MSQTLYNFPSSVRNVFSENPGLKFVDEFKVLAAKEMVCVMLIADHGSPLTHLRRMKKDKELRMQAVKKVGYVTPTTESISREGQKIVNKENENVEKAIEVYRAQQGVDTIELLETIEGKIQQYILQPGEVADDYLKGVSDLVHRGILTKIEKQKQDIQKLSKNHIPDGPKEEEAEKEDDFVAGDPDEDSW